MRISDFVDINNVVIVGNQEPKIKFEYVNVNFKKYNKNPSKQAHC